jgi:tryptophan 6-halogenase
MKIVIVGGGTAGWLAALMIKKVHSNHDITVVESTKIGIVGAGEGSTGYLTDIIQGNTWDYGCNEKDFLIETDATLKLGIKHKDWSTLGKEYIAPIDGTYNGGLCDGLLLETIITNLPLHTASINGYHIEHNSSSFYYENEKLNNSHSHAYHFDAHLVGKYFKKVCGNEITHIDCIIKHINLDENGFVSSIIGDNGLEIFGDFFVDATGFSRTFFKPMNNKWVSYQKNLPVNTAMPFILPYEKNEKIEPLTVAWAQKAGWMWQIPTQSRKGCGYVFDDNFITHDQAQQEIETVLGHEIKPIKFLKFETGRAEQPWIKNCLWLGLSCAFAEPLEATSIHSTIVQLQNFVFDYLKDTKEDTCNNGSISIYNNKISKMYDDFKEFLILHYAGNRTDSEFWKWIETGETMTPFVKTIIEMQKSKHLKPNDILGYYGHAGASLYNWILAGLGYLTKDVALKELNTYGYAGLAKDLRSVHDYNMKKIVSKCIDNTEFVRNMEKHLNGN